MELIELQRHIRRLAMLDENASPVISSYFNLERGPAAARQAFDERVRIIRKTMSGNRWQDFNEACSRIDNFIKTELLPESKGVAVFARGGDDPFFLPLQFRVPLPNQTGADTTPNIFPLVELKDTCHRYVVLISTTESARIIEVSLGEITDEVWCERPELRRRTGREWSREHYRNHRRNRTEQFIREKIEVLERLMLAGGHTHLMLAGNPRLTARVKKELPKHLADKLVDTVVASGSDKISDVVAATLNSFIEQEELESQAIAEQLRQEVCTGGLAVIGTSDTLAALQRAQVDVLVMLRDYAPPSGWKCPACGAIGFAPRQFNDCSECGASEIHQLELREEMTRLAEKCGCQVEIVNHSEAMVEFGGVGALLRFLAPEQYYQRQAAAA